MAEDVWAEWQPCGHSANHYRPDQNTGLERCEICEHQNAVAAESFARIAELEAALSGLKYGQDPQCWCDVSIDSPMQRTHSDKCRAAQKAMTPK